MANHPTPIQYVQIAIFLALVTAIEVGLFYAEEVFGGFVIPMLLLLSALKFAIVVGWYMHLRYEKPVMQRFFASGFALAFGLYAFVLAMLGAAVTIFAVS